MSRASSDPESEELRKELRQYVAPYDSRFPNKNQSRHCYQYYLDFHRCQKAKGSDYEPCEYFKNVYKDLCPSFWVEKWDTQVAEGRFAGRI